jgi:hypothetical protein
MTEDAILRSAVVGGDYIKVDEATALAAARALAPDPHLALITGDVLATMMDGVIRGRSFDDLGVADTAFHRVRFAGLQDDHFRFPDDEKWRIPSDGPMPAAPPSESPETHSPGAAPDAPTDHLPS